MTSDTSLGLTKFRAMGVLIWCFCGHEERVLEFDSAVSIADPVVALALNGFCVMIGLLSMLVVLM